jgi:hypothetical protein
VYYSATGAWRPKAATVAGPTGPTGPAFLGTQTLTDGSSIAWNLASGAFATVTLGGSRTLSNPTNMANGNTYLLLVTQGSGGSHTLSFDTDYKWPGGTAPTLSIAAGKVDVLTFISDGSYMYGVATLGF